MTDWMQLAIQEANQAAREGEIPVGAVIVRDGKVIAAAHNRREADQDPTAHAEMLCLKQAAKITGSWRLTGCTMYVTLEPCPMCAGAILMSRLSSCCFGARDPAYGCCGSVYDLPADPKLNGTTRWQSGDGNEEASALLTDFFHIRRKKEFSDDAE